MPVDRFYWLIQDALAGCSRPGGTAGRDVTLDDDLRWLRAQGIGAVLSLTETPVREEVLVEHGLVGLHLPVDDLTAPAPEQFLDALQFIDEQRASDRAVAVHCKMGQGRTATILAAHLIRHGASPEEALQTVRALCPGAVGSTAQERALDAFAARRDWLI
jgi:atypical dual specificity phosphatase